ncbi:MAG: hypothetical protein ABJB69_03680 [Spartobacteria bacterium]
MKAKIFTATLVLAGILQLALTARSQDVDDPAQVREQRLREAAVNSLSLEEQLKLRAAEQKAAEDPIVQAALEKRKKAVREFRETLRAEMLRIDPSLKPVLDKIKSSGN